MTSATSASVLLITRDDLLRDDLLRLAAASGARLDLVRDSTDGLRSWAAAAVVLVGADMCRSAAELQPPRREHVHVVGHGPLGDDLFRDALRVGAADVVEIPLAEDWLVEILTDATDASAGGPAGPGRTIGVVAGSGGAGATTFACALALTAAALAQDVTLLDLDPLGPGADRVVGLEAAEGVRWDALVSSRGRLGSQSLRAALPLRDRLAVLTWGLGAPVRLDVGVVREVLSAAQRGTDLVVVDLPRAADDVTAEVVARCDQVLVLTDPTVAGVVCAGKVAATLRPLNDHLGLAVRTGAATSSPDQVAAALGLPVVTEIGHQRRLAEHLDLGLGPVHGRRSPLARAARATLGHGARRRAVA